VFLSPTIADRYASALQPIAVADRDAAIAGAVSTLRARFFVLPEELAVALVQDTGWSVADVSTLLRIPTLTVRNALRNATLAAPRVGARPPTDLDELGDEAALVEGLLGDVPQHRRDAAGVLAQPDTTERVDVELSTSLPAYLGRPELEERMRRSDRVQRIVVNGAAVAILGVVALTLGATRPVEPDPALPEDAVVAVEPVPRPTAQPTSEPARPTSDADEQVPLGPIQIDDLRFVASVDPATGEPGPSLEEASIGDDPRLWLRLIQMPGRDAVLRIRFTAPNGRSTVRPVLVRDRIPLVSVRLPDELGREPGRYAATVEADELEPRTVEIELTPAA
jgi:hypothetical protein